MTMTKAEAGRLGGITTRDSHAKNFSENFGVSFYETIGKRGGDKGGGGRPRALTIADIGHSQPKAAVNKERWRNQDASVPSQVRTNSLAKLTRLWMQRQAGLGNSLASGCISERG